MLKHIYTIQKEDVGLGIYRTPFRSSLRTLLCTISMTFGGISPKDVGVKIYQAQDGQLVWGRLVT